MMEPTRPARRGRPPLQDNQEASDSPHTRQQRMRLAQRTYRARKQAAEETSRARAEELSHALDHALATYSILHDRLLGCLQSQDLPGILANLNDATAHMAAIASSTNKTFVLPPTIEDPSLSSQCSEKFASPQEAVGIEHYSHAASEIIDPHGKTNTSQFPPDQSIAGTYMTVQTAARNPMAVSARIARACFQRVVSIASSHAIHKQKAATLTIPLQLLSEQALLFHSLNALSIFQSFVVDFRFPPNSNSRQPRLYRVVEGGTRTVSRVPAPFVQQTIRGKTRTVLDTNFAPLQGEWLEAVDVEEYLEERGICLRNAITNSKPLTADSEYHESVLAPRKTLGEKETPSLNYERSEIQVMRQRPTVIPSSQFPGHEPADYTVFGLSEPRTNLSHATIPSNSSLATWVDATQHSCPGIGLETAHRATDVSRITVDLDKLVYLLAENAVCLGPVPGIRKEAVDSSIRASIILET